MHTVLRCALMTLTAALSAGLHAQNSQIPAGSSFCLLRTAPAPRCDRFLITEFAIHPRATVEGEGSASYLAWEAGMMVNKGEDAWGGTLFIGVDGRMDPAKSRPSAPLSPRRHPLTPALRADGTEDLLVSGIHRALSWRVSLVTRTDANLTSSA